MNDEMRKDELNEELFQREEAMMDTLLRRAAEADDAEVDYAGMLRSIKAEAKSEGIVVFPAARKKPRITAKRLLAGFGTAAAVFVVGLGVLAALKAFPFSPKAASPSGDVTANAEQTHSSSADAVKSSDLAPTAEPGPQVTEAWYADVTEAPVYATAEPEPSFEADVTMFPTETAMRGGVVGFIELGSFDAMPDDVDSLLPELLPTFMEQAELEPLRGDSPLEARAIGTSDQGEDYYYTCRVDEEFDEELSVGVAKYELSETGELSYVWRITEDTCLRIDLLAFDRATAERLLTSLAIENSCRTMPTETAVGE